MHEIYLIFSLALPSKLLKDLNLFKTKLTDEDLEALWTTVEALPALQLRRLSLGSNRFVRLARLGDLLRRMPALTHLVLKENERVTD